MLFSLKVLVQHLAPSSISKNKLKLRGCGNFFLICLTPGGGVGVLTNLRGYLIRNINLPDLQLGALMATAE